MTKNELRFPKRFLWGVGTAAHQVEGGNHNNWSVWELENANSFAKAAEYKIGHLQNWPTIKKQARTPDNYVSGRAIDHYNRYESDFDLMKKMDPERYNDRGAFMRRYGADTLASKDALKREMARYVYPSKIDPDVAADRKESRVKLQVHYICKERLRKSDHH
jgi:hypothetical protein